MSQDNPFAAPEAEIGVIPEYTETRLADRGTRFAAAILDGLISIVFSLPVMFALGFFNNLQARRTSPLVRPLAWVFTDLSCSC